MQAVTVKIENWYSDGYESKSEAIIVAEDTLGDTPDDLEEWFVDTVYQHTGDGHGIGRELGSVYVATIISCDNQDLLGKSYEWVD